MFQTTSKKIWEEMKQTNSIYQKIKNETDQLQSPRCCLNLQDKSQDTLYKARHFIRNGVLYHYQRIVVCIELLS